MSGPLESTLISFWEEVYRNSPQLFNLSLENFQKRFLGSYLLTFNPDAPKNPSPYSNTAFTDFEDTPETFSIEDLEKVVCWVDFDNEEVTKEKPEEDKEQVDKEVEDSFHPVFVNPYPLVQGHSLLALFPEECLPQAISTELLTLAMNIFRITENPTLRLGYDSIGANCDINHLHLHLLFLDLLGLEKFPVETAGEELLLESSLQHKDEEEINMFSIGIKLLKAEFPSKCFIIKPSVEVSEANISEATESLGNVAGIIVNYCIEENIPHSLIIADSGLSIYVFIRSYQTELSTSKATFLDLGGVPFLHSEEKYQSIDEEKIAEYLESLSASQETWQQVSNYTTSLLKSLYH